MLGEMIYKCSPHFRVRKIRTMSERLLGETSDRCRLTLSRAGTAAGASERFHERATNVLVAKDFTSGANGCRLSTYRPVVKSLTQLAKVTHDEVMTDDLPALYCPAPACCSDTDRFSGINASEYNATPHCSTVFTVHGMRCTSLRRWPRTCLDPSARR